jgi:predicted TPR repeat methyltransferase
MDSARGMYERLVDTPSDEIWYDPGHPAHGYLRLGQIAEEAGDRTKAAEYYTQLVGLLSEADAQLQPLVTQARSALGRLTREPGRT